MRVNHDPTMYQILELVGDGVLFIHNTKRHMQRLAQRLVQKGKLSIVKCFECGVIYCKPGFNVEVWQ